MEQQRRTPFIHVNDLAIGGLGFAVNLLVQDPYKTAIALVVGSVRSERN